MTVTLKSSNYCSQFKYRSLVKAPLLYPIRAQERAIKRLNLNFPGGFPQANGALPNWMGGMF
jgi:hypothetical protein